MRHAKRQAMAQDAAKKEEQRKSRGRPLLQGAATLLFACMIGLGGYQLLNHPDTPLPTAWNPTIPLRIDDPVTPITTWKLNRATANPLACQAALDGFAALQQMSDLNTSEQCHIRNRVNLSSVGDARLTPVETRCAIALRMAMWERHSLQPAAAAHLGSRLTRIDHFGSYSCRTIRTPAGPSSRMSTHASAEAIDIAGFGFADGRTIQLQRDWQGNGPEAAFLRAARDGACDWFSLTLSPDYNSLHADHFHLQSRGWGLCR